METMEEIYWKLWRRLTGNTSGDLVETMEEIMQRFELADGGTLFLDEIGEMKPHTQVKLLRALQEGEFERVGGTKTINVDVRILAATNKDLQSEVKEGRFREDLYYRLKVVPVHLPPLRERKDDIPALVRHFIGKFNKEMGRHITNVSPQAMDIILDYHYPGNIREMENILQHAFVRCGGKTIHPKHLPKDIGMEKEKTDLIKKIIKTPEPLKELEKETILNVLNETGWKYAESARRLGVGRTTLWRRMKEFDIEKEGYQIGN
ncbi:MAG: sigma 54-interacting transcriptional regulator [bacterium]|nr:sigma 54-interacting transcriptional regulator [bacterium]